MDTLTLIILTVLSSVPQEKQMDVHCVARAIYHEARGETIIGQRAVAHVINNRVTSSKYPNSYCDVVYQHKQFSNLYKTTKIDTTTEQYKLAVLVSYRMINGLSEDPTNGATHYYAYTGSHKVNDPWPAFEVRASIGNHQFKYGW